MAILLVDITGTIQQVSSNRFILGVGFAWDKRAFANLGVNYRKRGSITNEELKSSKTREWRV